MEAECEVGPGVRVGFEGAAPNSTVTVTVEPMEEGEPSVDGGETVAVGGGQVSDAPGAAMIT